MVYANDFLGNTDSDILNAAIKGRDEDGIVIIGARKAVGGQSASGGRLIRLSYCQAILLLFSKTAN